MRKIRLKRDFGLVTCDLKRKRHKNKLQHKDANFLDWKDKNTHLYELQRRY